MRRLLPWTLAVASLFAPLSLTRAADADFSTTNNLDQDVVGFFSKSLSQKYETAATPIMSPQFQPIPERRPTLVFKPILIFKALGKEISLQPIFGSVKGAQLSLSF